MKKTLFNDGFMCKVLPYDSSYLDISFGIKDWQYDNVDIPHDAAISNAYNFYTDKVIWYRKKLDINPEEGKRYILYFEGVYFDASVYINNTLVGRWVNGYTSFNFDITDYLTGNRDCLYVSIDYRCPNSRWYAGPGINRDVWLYEADTNHFEVDSLYVCPKKSSDNDWNLNISVNIDENSKINPSDTSVMFHCEELNIHTALLPENNNMYTASVEVSNPKLWDIASPNMYKCYAELLINEAVTDSIDTGFGFRHIEFSPESGLFLNGRNVKLNGVCLHSDQGCLGTAFHKDMARYQLNIMMDMGVNAIRLAHNVQAPGFLDLCDELGLLVLNEAFDCWKLPKTTYDYARFFEEWSAKDIRSWIVRDRNHPCVFLWSAGNEIYDTHAGEDGAKTLKYIAEEIRKNDFYSHAQVTLCSNYMAWDNTIKAVDFLKIVGYNYGELLYGKHHEEHPDWVIFGSETASLVQSRGVYHFPAEKSLLVDDDNHCSSLGNCATSWGAKNMDFCVYTERDTPYSMGQFLWSGIDYLGEPTPYHTKNSYFGAVDTACFAKDVFYMLQSEWRSCEDKPVIHILPYWDFNEGQPIDVRICSNAPTVELFFNDVSLGKKNIDHKNGKSFYADYKIPYKTGILSAAGYDEEGHIIAEATESSFLDTASLHLSVSSFDVGEDDRSLRFVTIQAIDVNGNPVRNASDRINVSVDGPAKLIGMCNGNQTDMDSFTGSSMRLFNGKLLAIVKPTGTSGHITINASLDTEKIYVRKLEIKTDCHAPLTPQNPSMTAHIQIHPLNAQYKNIEYQITNDIGTPIQNASVKPVSEDGLTVSITAVADAEFCIRALCREDDDRITVISSLPLTAEGFGELNKNPYDFISGSLYDDFQGDLGNGNEKGVATSRLVDSAVIYKNMDFGLTGSKEVTIPIFELGGDAVPMTFWCGTPHAEGSYVIGRSVYHKPSIWNVYQEETFKLDKVLTGIQDFAIEVFKQKIHIKGIQFIPHNPAYDTHPVKDAENIYGDQFSINEDVVTGIGNNVCITYKNMDFGAEGADKIHIVGRTLLQQNTIHIRLQNENGEDRQIIEFPHSDELTGITFDLSPMKGSGDLSFIFLPGSDFDFKEFTFMNDSHPLQSENPDRK